jgi:hypothetical protein
VVAKVGDERRHFRLQKEALWLRRASSAGIACPHLLLDASDHRTEPGIIMTPCGSGARRDAWYHARAIPLALAPHRPDQGWGSLRADGRCRWKNLDALADWYASQAKALGPDIATTWQQLRSRLELLRRGCIHGDLHRGNIIGAQVIDWEAVAVADPWEEAARLWLTMPRPDHLLRRWAIDPSHSRWQLVMTMAAIESAAFAGPRQAGARRLLGLLPS